ncbi:hypothetical protein [uncultured Arcobacter sp.]|uniref:hypothetical protein n=1 Tax=uncultured Arcobacter sp. TaxID=165434 RepID=UPI00261769F0|nr:hypothetical protein [uncultured Arcobacter sp.]
MKIISFVGKAGSGKGYQMMKHLEDVKSNGYPVMCMSLADPLKELFRKNFGMYRDGSIDEDVYKYLETAHDVNIGKGILDYTAGIYNRTYGYDYTILNEKIQEASKHVPKVIEAIKNKDIRKCLQLYGTEVAHTFSNSIWVDFLLKKLFKLLDLNFIDSELHVYIDDMRFATEYDTISNFANVYGYKFECYGVECSDEVRCERRNMTMDELKVLDSHKSEQEVGIIIDKLEKEYIINNN